MRRLVTKRFELLFILRQKESRDFSLITSIQIEKRNGITISEDELDIFDIFVLFSIIAIICTLPTLTKFT